MRNCVRKTLPLAIAVLLIGAGVAFGGQNAGVTFSLGSAAEVSGIGAAQTVSFNVDAAGMSGVKQIDITIQVSPADAFDLSATTHVDPSGFIAPGQSVDAAAGTFNVGMANFMAALDGDANIISFTLTTSDSFTASTEATISVQSISLGPTSSDRDVFDAAAVGVSATVNPPAPAPEVSAIAPAEGSVSGGTDVAITGANFEDGATVTIGGAAATAVTWVDATSLTATTPAGTEGVADVVVTNTDGQASTLAGGFTYVGIVEPGLSASTATDASLDYSAVGSGSAADDSDGEVDMGVVFTDASGAAASGADVTFTVTNNGAETVSVVGAGGQEIGSGEVVAVVVATDAEGAAGITLDAEGDRDAGTTSVGVTATITAANSEGVSRDLSVDFSATWDVPVVAELAAFAGGVTPDRDVVLRWSVVSQSGNLGWEVFRSADGSGFEQVGELVAGAGTSDEYLSYSFRDVEVPTVDVVQYYLRQIDADGTYSRSSVVEIGMAGATVVPVTMALMQNFPNPFNPETVIGFDVSEESVVSLRIFDLTGQVVRTLLSGERFGVGHYQSVWDGRSDAGVRVASGVYFYELGAGKFASMKKMTLLR